MPTPSRYYSNVAVAGTLGAAIGGASSVAYLALTPTGYPQSFPFTLAIDPGNASFELVSVVGGAGTSGNPWQILRGYDGTIAQSHSAGAVVQHEFSASDVYTSRLHEASVAGSGVHGLPSTAWTSTPFTVLQETVLSNSTTNAVSFSGIPATYNHLMLVVSARLTETTAAMDWATINFNGDAGSYYSYVTLGASNIAGALAPVTASSYNTTGMPVVRLAASSGGNSVNVGAGYVIIPWYSQTAFNKTCQAVSGGAFVNAAQVDGEVGWGFYNPPVQAVLTSLSISTPSQFFLSGSAFGLYAW